MFLHKSLDEWIMDPELALHYSVSLCMSLIAFNCSPKVDWFDIGYANSVFVEIIGGGFKLALKICDSVWMMVPSAS